MGIPSYFSSVVKKHGKILKPLSFYEPRFFQNMYMDCNSIIYDAVRTIEQPSENFEMKLIQNVIETIESYIKLISPSNTIYIAFDGVAPFAKMNQQRTRRFKGDFMAKNTFVNNTSTSEWSTRSEERRVGKERRSRWSPDHSKKKKKKTRYGSIGNLSNILIRTEQTGQ